MRGEEQQLIWPAPKPYHRQSRFHNGHPNTEIGYVPGQQSQMQQSSSKSSGGTRQMETLEKQEGKGVAAATLWGGQSKQRFSYQPHLPSPTEPHNRNNGTGKLRHMSHSPICYGRSPRGKDT